MAELFVQRGLGDNRGPDITNIILVTLQAKLDRGANELDTNSGLDEVELIIKYRTGIAKGDLIEVHDILQGSVWFGKITGIRHVASGGVIETELSVVRPSDFLI